jgi:hypothetical protein
MSPQPPQTISSLDVISICSTSMISLRSRLIALDVLLFVNPIWLKVVPVCKVMRYLMYAHSYGDTERARRKFRRIPSRIRHSMAALDYAEAEAHCPRNMPIGRLMRSAVNQLS